MSLDAPQQAGEHAADFADVSVQGMPVAFGDAAQTFGLKQQRFDFVRRSAGNPSVLAHLARSAAAATLGQVRTDGFRCTTDLVGHPEPTLLYERQGESVDPGCEGDRPLPDLELLEVSHGDGSWERGTRRCNPTIADCIH